MLIRFHHSRQYIRYAHRYRWKHFPERVKTPPAKSVLTVITFWLILLNPLTASITCHPFYSHQHICRTHSNKVSFRLLRCRRVLEFVFRWPCWTHKIKSFANVCIIPYRNLCSLNIDKSTRNNTIRKRSVISQVQGNKYRKVNPLFVCDVLCIFF